MHLFNLSFNLTTNKTMANVSELIEIQQEYSTDVRNLIILICISFVIIAVNGTVVVAFIIGKSIRKRPANVLICSQASIDLFTGIAYIPTFQQLSSLRLIA